MQNSTMGVFLITTTIQLSDAYAFLELAKDEEIMSEFPNMRFKDINEAQEYLNQQIEINNVSEKNFFRAIRIIFDTDTGEYTDSNSILIGFISLHDVGTMDSLLTGGFHQNLSYAIKQQYRRKGLMTRALNLTLNAMIENGYNLVPALVKPNNIPSEKVLLKCGFDKVNSTPMGNTYVKRLCMDEYRYRITFGL